MQRFLFITSGVLMAAAVATGALGAHALKNVLTADQLSAWHTAAHYQVYHALAVLISAVVMYKFNSRWLSVSACLFLSGILCFSGSIYVLVFIPEGNIMRQILGPVTPLGGLQFIAGWLCFVIAFVHKKSIPT